MILTCCHWISFDINVAVKVLREYTVWFSFYKLYENTKVNQDRSMSGKGIQTSFTKIQNYGKWKNMNSCKNSRHKKKYSQCKVNIFGMNINLK